MNIAIYSEQLGNLGGAEKYGLMLAAPLLGKHSVTVIHRSMTANYPLILGERFHLDCKDLSFRYVHSDRAALRAMKGVDLVLNITDASLLPNVGQRGILCVFFPIPLNDYPVPDSFPTQALTQTRQRLLELISDWCPTLMHPRPLSVGEFKRQFGLLPTLCRSPLFALRSLAWRGLKDRRYGRSPLGTYDRLVACSSYGGKWIHKLYGLPADVLYPAIETGFFRPRAKAKEIIAVGRFDNSEKSKKFHVLIDVFKSLFDSGDVRDWTFHCCGGLHGSETEAYLHALRHSAAGYPVEFHPNIPFDELAERYSTASMFWHAMGYGEDESVHPWRFEHFGMTTVEAMAAGCIPVVINAGGQPEIVSDPSEGYLWDTLDQFKAAVREIVRLSAEAMKVVQIRARERAEFFSPKAFFERAIGIYQALGIPTRSIENLLANPVIAE